MAIACESNPTNIVTLNLFQGLSCRIPRVCLNGINR